MKLFFRFILAIIILNSSISFSVGGTIVGSKHDLSYQSTLNQLCIYCHTPHNSDATAPLWNRFFSADGSAFKLYSAVGSANITFGSGLTSDSISLLCMSCHDGLTTIDGGMINTITATSTPVTGPANFGTDLSKHHPINFQVSPIDIQNDLWVSGGSFTGGYMGRDGGVNAYAGPYDKKFPLFSLKDGRTGPRSLECPSCHSVHDSQYQPFLRDTMTGSKLCLACHNK